MKGWGTAGTIHSGVQILTKPGEGANGQSGCYSAFCFNSIAVSVRPAMSAGAACGPSPLTRGRGPAPAADGREGARARPRGAEGHERLEARVASAARLLLLLAAVAHGEAAAHDHLRQPGGVSSWGAWGEGRSRQLETACGTRCVELGLSGRWRAP